MTLKEACNRLYDHSLLGYINGEKFTKKRLYNMVSSAFKDGVSLKIPDKYVLEVCLPDGRWYCSINRYNHTADGFDYWIPESRNQEAKLLHALYK